MEFTEEDRLFLESHNVCKFDYKDHRFYSCRECDSLIDCMERAWDAEVGYEMFCYSIVGCGYDSMEEFWECNGI